MVALPEVLVKLRDLDFADAEALMVPEVNTEARRLARGGRPAGVDRPWHAGSH